MKKLIAPLFLVIIAITAVKVFNLYSTETKTEAKNPILHKHEQLKEFTNIDEINKNTKKMSQEDIDRHIKMLKDQIAKYQKIQIESVFPFETGALGFLISIIETYLQILEAETIKRAATA